MKINIKDFESINYIKNVDDKESFIKKYIFYSYILLNYLYKKIDLYIYEEMFKKYNFKNVDPSAYDIFQKLSSDFSKYIYIRNVLHIERLTKTEEEWLLNKMNDNNYVYDIESENFILNTFYRVVIEDYQSDYNVSYGIKGADYIKPCYSLVFGIRYDEFYREGETEEEWMKKHGQQLFNLEIIESFINDKIYNELKVPACIIKY